MYAKRHHDESVCLMKTSSKVAVPRQFRGSFAEALSSFIVYCGHFVSVKCETEVTLTVMLLASLPAAVWVNDSRCS